jgi:hypothetical protein
MATATISQDVARRGVLYPHAQWYFLAAMVVTWVGFARSYFAVVRTEPWVHHVHGALMGGWIALLVIQPMLYQRGRMRLHRTLGKWAVYLWVPAMVGMGLMMDRRMLQTQNAPPSAIEQLAFLDLISLIFFAVLIVLSVVYARTVELHARYIVCTVLLLVPPALARALFLVPGMRTFQLNVNVAEALMGVVLLVLMVDDKRRGKVWLPYPMAFAVFTAMTVASNFVRGWGWWHVVSGWLAGGG